MDVTFCDGGGIHEKAGTPRGGTGFLLRLL
jgi:hypothetical protein